MRRRGLGASLPRSRDSIRPKQGPREAPRRLEESYRPGQSLHGLILSLHIVYQYKLPSICRRQALSRAPATPPTVAHWQQALIEPGGLMASRLARSNRPTTSRALLPLIPQQGNKAFTPGVAPGSPASIRHPRRPAPLATDEKSGQVTSYHQSPSAMRFEIIRILLRNSTQNTSEGYGMNSNKFEFI
mgnify:CR=1 FL=1